MAETKPSAETWSAAYHEAGHCVISHHEGVPVVQVSIATGTDGVGFIDWAPEAYDGVEDDPTRVEASVRSIQAGAVAQHMHDAESFKSLDAFDDVGSALDLLRTLTDYEDAHDAIYERREAETQRLLDRPEIWSTVQAVAAALIQHDTLSGEQIIAIIAAANEERPQRPNHFVVEGAGLDKVGTRCALRQHTFSDGKLYGPQRNI